MANTDRFLITGALGCIGAWAVRNLIREEDPHVVVYDVAQEPTRHRLLLSDDELARVVFEVGDVADLDAIQRVLDLHDITHVVHLAGLQVPFCRADPPLGARVNVLGTVNIFEAIKRTGGQVKGLSYASSVAVFGAPEDYETEGPLPDDAPLIPHTHYGVYKQANEGTAHVYWHEDGISSVGLRPYVVYGVCRDQGITSTPTTAMLAAAAGVSYHISYGGRTVFQYADDTASAFVQAARAEFQGAGAYNFGGLVPHMREVVQAIESAEPSAEGRITFEDIQLPFPVAVDGSGLESAIGPIGHRKLEEGVAETLELFRTLIRERKIDPESYIAERS